MQSDKANVLRTMCVTASTSQTTRAMASTFQMSSVRVLFLPDTESQGKCSPDNMRQGICLPDEECQGLFLPDAECQGKCHRDHTSYGICLLDGEYQGILLQDQCVYYRSRVSR